MTAETSDQSWSVRGGLGLAYGAIVYVFFLGTFLYTIGFVEGGLTLGSTNLVPRTIDEGPSESATATALAVDLGLLSLFAVQHSLMARRGFKRRWTRIVPAAVERSTYVLAATVCLAALMAFWRPIDAIVWEVSASWLRATLVVVSLGGWALVLVSTFLINHVELFGLRQVHASSRGRRLPPPRFVTPLWYRAVRHPLYLGFLIAFWVAPTMTVGHLLFAVATTGYIFVGIAFEERDLVDDFGDEYRDYRRRVPMLIPRRGGG